MVSAWGRAHEENAPCALGIGEEGYVVKQCLFVGQAFTQVGIDELLRAYRSAQQDQAIVLVVALASPHSIA